MLPNRKTIREHGVIQRAILANLESHHQNLQLTASHHMLGIERAAGAQRNPVLTSPHNLTVERRIRGQISVRVPFMIKGRGTRRTVGERRNRSVRNTCLRVELAV